MMRVKYHRFKLTHVDFLKELAVKNPNVIVLDKYEGLKFKIPCQCTVCGNKWSARAVDLLSGQICPECESTNKLR